MSRDCCWQGLGKGVSTSTAGTFSKATVSARFVLSAGDPCPSRRQSSSCLPWPGLAVVQHRRFVPSSLVSYEKSQPSESCGKQLHQLSLRSAPEKYTLLIRRGRRRELFHRQSPAPNCSASPLSLQNRTPELSALSAPTCCKVNHLISWPKKVTKRKQLKSEFPCSCSPIYRLGLCLRFCFLCLSKLTRTRHASRAGLPRATPREGGHEAQLHPQLYVFVHLRLHIQLRRRCLL